MLAGNVLSLQHLHHRHRQRPADQWADPACAVVGVALKGVESDDQPDDGHVNQNHMTASAKHRLPSKCGLNRTTPPLVGIWTTLAGSAAPPPEGEQQRGHHGVDQPRGTKMQSTSAEDGLAIVSLAKANYHSRFVVLTPPST